MTNEPNSIKDRVPKRWSFEEIRDEALGSVTAKVVVNEELVNKIINEFFHANEPYINHLEQENEHLNNKLYLKTQQHDCCKENYTKMEQENKTLREAFSVLLEAVKFYGDQEHFSGDQWEHPSGEPMSILCWNEEPLHIESGGCARYALESESVKRVLAESLIGGGDE